MPKVLHHYVLLWRHKVLNILVVVVSGVVVVYILLET